MIVFLTCRRVFSPNLCLHICMIFRLLLELIKFLLVITTLWVILFFWRGYRRAFIILVDVLHLGVLPVDIMDRIFLLLKTVRYMRWWSLRLNFIGVLRCVAFGRWFILRLRRVVPWRWSCNCATKGNQRFTFTTLFSCTWMTRCLCLSTAAIIRKRCPRALSLILWQIDQISRCLAHRLLLAQHLSLLQDHVSKLLSLVTYVKLAVIVHSCSFIGQVVSIACNRWYKSQVIVTTG